MTGHDDVRRRRSDARWGELVMREGFVIIPSTFFVAQRRLGISANEFNILLQIMSFWWDSDRHPFPSRRTLAERMHVGVKTVQRTLAGLEERGLLKRVVRINPSKGRQANGYDLSGLVAALKPIALETSEIRAKRQRLDRPR